MCKIEENTIIFHQMLFRGEESMKIEELKNFKHIPEEEFDRDSLVDISNIDIQEILQMSQLNLRLQASLQQLLVI